MFRQQRIHLLKRAIAKHELQLLRLELRESEYVPSARPQTLVNDLERIKQTIAQKKLKLSNLKKTPKLSLIRRINAYLLLLLLSLRLHWKIATTFTLLGICVVSLWCPSPPRKRLRKLGFSVDKTIDGIQLTATPKLKKENLVGAINDIRNAWTTELDLSQLGKLNSDQMSSLTRVCNLVKLNLTDTGINDDCLRTWSKRLTDLKELKLGNCALTDTEYLSCSPNLERLEIISTEGTDCKINNLQVIDKLNKLEFVKVSCCPNFHGLSIQQHSQLKELHIHNCPLLDLELASLQNLTNLVINNAPLAHKEAKMYSICDMERLHSVEISETVCVTDLYISHSKNPKVSTAFQSIKILNNKGLRRLILDDIEATKGDILAVDNNQNLSDIFLFEIDLLNYREVSFIPHPDQKEPTTIWVTNLSTKDKLIKMLEKNPFVFIRAENKPVVKLLTTERRKYVENLITDHKRR